MADYKKLLEVIMKDTAAKKCLFEFCKSEYSTENFYFIDLESWSAENIYRTYLAKNAKRQVNLTAQIMKRADELAKKELWDDAGWPKIVEDAQTAIEKLMCGDTLKRFVKSAQAKELPPAFKKKVQWEKTFGSGS